jgi:hypothetical protein
MIKLFILINLISLNAMANSIIRSDFSGNIDAQAKALKNTQTAKDLGQDWDQENMYLLYGNVTSNVYFKKKAKLHVNWFWRYSQSELYENDSVAPRFSLYPNNVIKRDIFKLETIQEGDGYVTESILNSFNYEWGDEETVFTFGRMFVEFGEGKTFNPINPFMLPLAFSTLQNIQQGNDGLKFYINSTDRFRFHFYIFGDKQFTDYDGKITRTIMFRGDWDYSKEIHINYIIGEDQKRHKYGAEIKYSISDGAFYAQGVRNSQRLDKEDAQDKGLFHYLIGYRKNLSHNWLGRLEIGKFDQSNQYIEAQYNQNFLPQKNFVTLSNEVRLTDLVKIELNGSVDPTSRFSYFHLDVNHEYSKKMQFHVFISGPMSRAKEEDQFAAQRVFAGEFGLGLRSVF